MAEAVLPEILFGADEDEALLLALQFVFDEERDEGEVRERVHVDIEGWRRLDGVSFREHFRMTRDTFQKLIVVVGQHLRYNDRIIRLRTSLDTCLLMTLWILANGDTFRSTGSQFGVSKGVVFYHYIYLIEALRELSPRFIKWPTAMERDVIKAKFEDSYGYPGAVGCIDGVHVDVTAPLEQPERYINRHHRHSVLVQAVCDHRLLYRDIYAGNPGSVGDARMFARSPLSEHLLRRPDMINGDEHLLGDKAYPLMSHLMIPYFNDGHLNQQQRHHNRSLSKVRASVERSFSLLMSRYRRMKLFHSYSMQYCIDHIIASFMLHNFTILDGEDAQGIDHAQAIPEGHLTIEALQELREQSMEAGALKREYISRHLNAVVHLQEE